MDDLSGIIESILSQPDAMEQLQSMAQALGLDTQPEPKSAEPQQTSGLNDLFSPEQLIALMGAMNEASAPSETTSLLEALRPMLGSTRQGKLDRAIRALQLTNAAKSVSKALKG